MAPARQTGHAARPVTATVLLLLLVSQFLGVLGLSTPAQAAPGDRPVDVVIDAITPQVSGSGATIEVSGTLVNTTDVPVTNLNVRLQRGPVLDSRPGLADFGSDLSDLADLNDFPTAFLALDRPLAGGAELSFRYTTSAQALNLSANGVYPLLVNVNGQSGSEAESRVGEQLILLPHLAQAPSATTQLSWLWPLVAPPERNAAGVFTGTELANSLGSGGRLDRALAVLEGPVGPSGSPTAAKAVTLAVDPELLQAVTVLADGDYQLLVNGQAEASSIGSIVASNWLARLRTLAASMPVIALVYADPDLSSLISQGQGPAVERLLPDGPPGELVRDILGVAPVLSIAWPPAGQAADPAVVELLADHGVDQVVAGDQLTFVDQPDAESIEPVSTIETQSGEITALVGDSALSALTQADSRPGARSTTEQRFLAELVVTAAQAPEVGRRFLLTPPRDFDPVTAGALMDAAAQQAWLRTTQATELEAAVSAPTPRTLISPASNPLVIPRTELDSLAAAMRLRDDFASALSTPDVDLRGLDHALARAATCNRGVNLAPGSAAVTDAVSAVSTLRNSVSILAPTNGTYSLASADAPLVLTVVNDNPFAVEVMVALAPRGAPGVTSTPVVEVLPAQQRSTISVPADVQRSGSFTVIATVSSPAGIALGAPVQLRVHSTVYGPVALAITFGAGALLALLFARRSFTYWQRRRRRIKGGGGSADQETEGARGLAQPTLVPPPPRSPV